MKHFKGRWGIAMAVLSLLAVPSAWASSVQELIQANTGTFETTVVTVSTASVGNFAPGNTIYGFKLYADDAADKCGLYDVATLGGTAVTQGVFIDELSEPTDEDTLESDWPAPYKLVTDLTVVTNGICVIYHDVM